jgi:CHAT domain-containing protein
MKRSVRDAGKGDIGLNLSRLPSTLREADLITKAAPDGATKVITGFDANKTAAISANLGQYKIVHFATHAIINNEHPELSGIVLSLVDQHGNAQSGFLRLPDVYKLKLNSDLIVLSACRSGLGKNVSGEGFVGLTRGFTSAGTRSIVASLWKVDDEATSELMNHFYQAMFKEGLPPAAALQKAKQAMQANAAWHHPYYWAAFVLQGEYREGIQIRSSRAMRTPVVIALVTASGMLGFGLYAWSRRKRTIRVRE